MEADDESRYPVGDLADLGDGQMYPCTAGNYEVVICKVQGELYALEDLCSHADTTLSDGVLRGHTIICALHGAQFDVRNGRHLGPPAYTGVRTFELERGPEGVSVVVRRPAKKETDAPETGYFQTR